MSDDKYPEDTNRRRFVKGVVGGAALAGVGAAGATTVNTLTNPTGAGGGVTEFYGVENTDGPAPRAMPQIPIDIDEEGYLIGQFPTSGSETIGDIEYKPDWFQYCGLQTYPGVQPVERDNYFRYSEDAPYEWQSDVEAGGRMHVDDFSDYESWGNGIGDPGVGKPARGTWRSQDLSPQERLPIEVIRSTRVEEMTDRSDWLAESTAEGFVAYMDKCTHFCCVPGFKDTEQAKKFGASNRIFCVCHQSVYDPYSIVRRSFVALPRPEDGAGGGGEEGGEDGGN